MSGKIYEVSGRVPISRSQKYVFVLRLFDYINMLPLVEVQQNFVKKSVSGAKKQSHKQYSLNINVRPTNTPACSQKIHNCSIYTVKESVFFSLGVLLQDV